MENIVKRYFDLKKKQKTIENEMTELRSEIIKFCEENKLNDMLVGKYRVKVLQQERREFDDNLLYNSLPDPEMWKLISKSDQTKITGLIKINALSEEVIRDTFKIKKVQVLQVEKQ